MILSKLQIEDIATGVIKDFRETTGIYEMFTPIDQVASDYLSLEVKLAKLSDDASICGITAYDDTYVELFVNGAKQIMELKQNQVILDSSFIEPGKVRALCGKRRFTLAHEIAHQILFAMETDSNKEKYRKVYSARTAHTVRELKTHEDWNEWQANALGAAILMPQDGIEYFMDLHKQKNRLLSYVGLISENNNEIIKLFCMQFGVSKSAGIIRLKELGYLDEYSRTGGYIWEKLEQKSQVMR
ncbi:MAG: ImmA/IrrE family metallo-endopeptidase [Lachnospiraceae bacterium]